MLVGTKRLSGQNYLCRDKYLSWRKFCRDKNIFLSRQTNKFRDKAFVMTGILLSQPTRVWSDKTIVGTKKILVVVPTNDRRGEGGGMLILGR